MRKTLRTALASVLGTVLVSATMVGAASPASAADCGTAPRLGAEARIGTLDATAPEMWWTHTIDADSRVVSLAMPVGSATLEVRDASCTTVLCTDRASARDTATCTLERAGDVTIGVVGDPTGIVSDLPWVMAFVLDGLDVVPGCRDQEDNDFDGATDYPNDPECTSADDNTESPIRFDVTGTIEIKTDAAGKPQMALSGVFSPEMKKFTCWPPQPSDLVVEVICTQVRDTEFFYTCDEFVVTARAFSVPAAPFGRGEAKGSVLCDSGSAVTTDAVHSWESMENSKAVKSSRLPHVNLGTARFVHCQALGVSGAKPLGHYTVTCAGS